MVKKQESKPGSQLTKPERLNRDHDRAEFSSGKDALDHWLAHKALHNDQADASRTYVVCEDNQVIAYYCLATGAVEQSKTAGRLRRNMPDPIPVMILGRLAVGVAWQGQGIGAALLQDAFLRTIQVSEIASVKALMVHVISDKAVEFYKKWGFHPSPVNPKTLFLSIRQLKK